MLWLSIRGLTEDFEWWLALCFIIGVLRLGESCLIVGISGDFMAEAKWLGLLAALSKSKSFSIILSLKSNAVAVEDEAVVALYGP